MKDRELLEMAAKAAGYDIRSDAWACGPSGMAQTLYMGNRGPSWNPLTDDGDESRLESRCSLNVLWGDSSVTVVNYTSDVGCTEFFDEHGDDRQMARRTAGVRAAAEIGKEMS